MIGSILPPKVAHAELFHDPPDATLFPEEAAAIARAVERRRLEFTTGRHCAHVALRRLGVEPVPILRGERNAPAWPDGVVGSITHCAGYRAAAVAHAREVTGVGIDAEPDEPLPAGVLEAIALPDELDHLAALPAGRSWDRLLFCAKEAVYKVWFPRTGRFLEFDGARITLDPAGTFTAELLVDDDRMPAELAGRWTAAGPHLITAITL